MIKKRSQLNISKLKTKYSKAVESVDLNLLQQYINSGKHEFPESLVVYMELIEMIRSMYSKYETKNFIVNTLISETYGLSRYQANSLYYDALNFFYADNSVKQKAWENIYANHLDNLAYLAIEKDDIDTARKCFVEAAKLRGAGNEQGKEIPAEMLSKPVVIYTIDTERVGIPQVDRKQLAKFIDDIPEISERERVRLQKDAGITDVQLFDEIDEPKKD